MPWPEEEVVVQQGCSRRRSLDCSHVAELLQRYVHSSLSKLMVKVVVEGGSADSTVAACSLSQMNA